MKKILTMGLAFFLFAILPQFASAQETPVKEEVKKESKEVKKETKKIKKEEKKTKKEAKKGTKKMTDSDTQPGAVKEAELAKEDEVKPKKNEPRPYVSKPIEKPKKEPKTQHKVSKAEDQ